MLPTCTRNIKALHAVAMAILLSGFTPITVGAEQALQQIPLTLKAADLLPGTMLSGDGYRVNDKVVNDGFQNTYTLKTDYGDYSVIGNAALAARIQEIRQQKRWKKSSAAMLSKMPSRVQPRAWLKVASHW